MPGATLPEPDLRTDVQAQAQAVQLHAAQSGGRAALPGLRAIEAYPTTTIGSAILAIVVGWSTGALPFPGGKTADALDRVAAGVERLEDVVSSKFDSLNTTLRQVQSDQVRMMDRLTHLERGRTTGNMP